jgi:hypothetical protein
LLGEDDGTVPLGRALRTKLAKELTLLVPSLLLLLLFSCGVPVLINNFLPSIFDTMVAKETKKMRTAAPKRAIDIVSIAMKILKQRRERENAIWVLLLRQENVILVWFEAEKMLR